MRQPSGHGSDGPLPPPPGRAGLRGPAHWCEIVSCPRGEDTAAYLWLTGNPEYQGVALSLFLRDGSAQGPIQEMERRRSWLSGPPGGLAAAETAAPGDS